MASSPTPITKRPGIEPLTKRKAWKALQAHHSKVSKLHLRQLFAEDPKRGERMTDFWDPLVGWLAREIPRDAAVAEIARRYREFVDIFETGHATRAHAG
jgi:hypothetical protein